MRILSISICLFVSLQNPLLFATESENLFAQPNDLVAVETPMALKAQTNVEPEVDNAQMTANVGTTSQAEPVTNVAEDVADADFIQSLAAEQLKIAQSKTDKLTDAEKQYIQSFIGRTAFQMARSKSFVHALTSYPDIALAAVFFHAGTWLACAGLAASGHPLLAASIAGSPGATLGTATYGMFSIWLKKNKIRRSLGQNPDQLLERVFSTQPELIKARNFNITVDGDNQTVPISLRAESDAWLTRARLEAMADTFFLRQLRGLHLDEPIYLSVLLQKAATDPKSRSMILENMHPKIIQDSNESLPKSVVDFFKESNNLVEKMNIMAKTPKTNWSLSIPKLRNVLSGIKNKFRLADLADDLRLFQLRVLADFNQDRDESKVQLAISQLRQKNVEFNEQLLRTRTLLDGNVPPLMCFQVLK